MTRSLTLSLLWLACLAAITQAHVQTTPFEIGDEIPLECRRNLTAFPQAFTASLPPRQPQPLNPMLSPAAAAGAALASAAEDALWGPGLVCAESNHALSFRFGQDGFISCGWFVSNPDLYAFAAAVMKGDASWSCRVPMSKDRSFWLPVVIPLWGVVEPTHLHINYHMAFVFHVDEGRIIGAAAYPVRDQFQFVRTGSLLNLHGPVKWFHKHSYLPVSGPAPGTEGGAVVGGEGTGALGVLMWCIVSCMFGITASALLYVLRLKPMLVKKYLKGD